MSHSWVEPSTSLRFVVRDGKYILQQAWVRRMNQSGEVSGGSFDHWEDVPVEDEGVAVPARRGGVML